MNQKELEHEIHVATGVRKEVVELVLRCAVSLMMQSLRAQRDVVLTKFIRISSKPRKMLVYTTRPGETAPNRENRDKLILSVRPMAAFRQELNRWKNWV